MQSLAHIHGGEPRDCVARLHNLEFAQSSRSVLSTQPVQCDGSADISTHLNQLFNKGGSVYKACVKAAETHFSDIGAAETGNTDRNNQRVMGLLLLVFLRGKEIHFSKNHIEDITQATFCLDAPRPIAQLISDAQFWGVHRDISQENERIAFVLPPAVLDGLAAVIRELPTLSADPKQRNMKKDLMDDAPEQIVHASLVLHRLLAGTLMSHSNWLGLLKDSKSAANKSTKQLQYTPQTSTSHIRGLPCLPAEHSDGRLLGMFLGDLSHIDFHAFAKGPHSTSGADFTVRYGDDVTHLLVKQVCSASVPRLPP